MVTRVATSKEQHSKVTGTPHGTRRLRLVVHRHLAPKAGCDLDRDRLSGPWLMMLGTAQIAHMGVKARVGVNPRCNEFVR